MREQPERASPAQSVPPAHSPATIGALGEPGLIDRVRERLRDIAGPGEVFSGDDAAVVTAPGQRVLFTTDVLVEGVDFELEWATGRDVGCKAVAVNASDIAAMGGRPTYACVAVSLPGSTAVDWVEGLIEGLVEAAGDYAIKLVGGDVSEAREISIVVALLGAPGERIVTRTGARVGDAICVTGTLGASAVGLEALRSGRTDAAGSAIERHLRPLARVEEGTILAAAGATAMIDVSDGLARDLIHILDASGGVGCSIDPAAIPVDPSVDELETVDRMTAALVGGEDFELLCTLPPESVADAQQKLSAAGTQLTPIGTVTEGEARIGADPLRVWKERAWEHLRDR